MDDQQRACPYCGGKASIGGLLTLSAICEDCEASGPLCDTEAEAVDKWNRVAARPQGVE